MATARWEWAKMSNPAQQEILNEYPIMRRAMEKVAAARLSSLGKNLSGKHTYYAMSRPWLSFRV